MRQLERRPDVVAEPGGKHLPRALQVEALSLGLPHTSAREPLSLVMGADVASALVGMNSQ